MFNWEKLKKGILSSVIPGYGAYSAYKEIRQKAPQIQQGASQFKQQVKQTAQQYFAPTPQVRTRDVARELPGAAYDQGRAALSKLMGSGLNIEESMGQMPFMPANWFGKYSPTFRENIEQARGFGRGIEEAIMPEESEKPLWDVDLPVVGKWAPSPEEVSGEIGATAAMLATYGAGEKMVSGLLPKGLAEKGAINRIATARALKQAPKVADIASTTAKASARLAGGFGIGGQAMEPGTAKERAQRLATDIILGGAPPAIGTGAKYAFEGAVKPGAKLVGKGLEPAGKYVKKGLKPTLAGQKGFAKLPKKAPKIPKELQPLAKEARKYKSAEEFRKAVVKEPLEAGADRSNLFSAHKIGRSDTYVLAKKTGKTVDKKIPIVNEAGKRVSSRIEKTPELEYRIAKYNKSRDENLYNSFLNAKGGTTDLKKTESQLTSIYKQATKATPKPAPKPTVKPTLKELGKMRAPRPTAKGRAMAKAWRKPTVKAKVKAPEETTAQYMEKLEIADRQARKKAPGGTGGLINQIRTKLVDKHTSIEDMIVYAQKGTEKGYRKAKKMTPAELMSDRIDRTLRSPTLAGRFIEKHGLAKAVRKTPNPTILNNYLQAKRHIELVKTRPTYKTGRSLAQDKKLVSELGGKFETQVKNIRNHNNKLLDYSVETELMGKSLANRLKKMYPDYVPMGRVMTAIEEMGQIAPSRGKIHLGEQTVIRKLKEGSDKPIENVLGQMVVKTADTFAQGERNMAAKTLANSRFLPRMKGLIKEVKPGAGGETTFSYLDKGIKRTFKTTPEIANAAKNLDFQQWDIITKAIAVPVRIARLGITSLNPSFIASNLARDQVTAFINSVNPLRTSVANPPVFLKALWEAVGHGKMYDDWIRTAGGGTSFDISREAVKPALAKIRAGRNLPSKIFYTATRPGEFLRAIENIIGRAEELTRLQQFGGTRTSLLKQGYGKKVAERLAAKQSREATVNFARHGSWGKVLGAGWLYINAGFQGSRTLLRNLKTNPIGTATKIGIAALWPAAQVTIWNISDPKRKRVWDDIPEWEKENNLVIIPPDPTKNDDGTWNVIKIPISQEIRGLIRPTRQIVESIHGYDPPGFADLAGSLFETVSSLDVSNKWKAISTVTPQAVKVALEPVVNRKFFTGKEVVPGFLKGESLAKQVYPWTSGTARKIGKLIKVSPLKVETTVRNIMGGVGMHVLNLSDQMLVKAGVIPKDQIGGENVVQALQRRFGRARGGELMDKIDKGQKDAVGDYLSLYSDDKSRGKLYYSFREQALSKLGDEGKKVFDRWYRKDPKKSPWEKVGKASDLLSHPKVLKAQTDLQMKLAKATGDSVDPFYLLKPGEQKKVLTYQTFVPGSKEKSGFIEAHQWLPDFWEARGKFFNSIGLKQKGDFLKTPNRISKLQDTYFKLPSGTGQRTAFLKQYPELLRWWDKKMAYNNEQRVKMGLPKIERETFKKYASTKKGKGKGRGRSGGKVKAKIKMPLPKFSGLASASYRKVSPRYKVSAGRVLPKLPTAKRGRKLTPTGAKRRPTWIPTR